MRPASLQPANKIGSIVVKLPLPPACFPTLWQQDERFKESYLDGVSRLLQDGGCRIQG